MYTKPISFHYLFSINRRNHIHTYQSSIEEERQNKFERFGREILLISLPLLLRFPCIHNESLCDFEPSIYLYKIFIVSFEYFSQLISCENRMESSNVFQRMYRYSRMFYLLLLRELSTWICGK